MRLRKPGGSCCSVTTRLTIAVYVSESAPAALKLYLTRLTADTTGVGHI